MQFKAGDKVRRINDKNENLSVGDTGVVVAMENGYARVQPDKGGSSYQHDTNNLELITTSNMNLKDKFALVFKGEPEKSFIKAGVMNADESLTDDGQALFMAYLLKKNGDDFKTTVVDPILAEDEAK